MPKLLEGWNAAVESAFLRGIVATYEVALAPANTVTGARERNSPITIVRALIALIEKGHPRVAGIELPSLNADQLADKLRYLEKRYMKVRRGFRKSGSKPVRKPDNYDLLHTLYGPKAERSAVMTEHAISSVDLLRTPSASTAHSADRAPTLSESDVARPSGADHARTDGDRADHDRAEISDDEGEQLPQLDESALESPPTPAAARPFESLPPPPAPHVFPAMVPSSREAQFREMLKALFAANSAVLDVAAAIRETAPTQRTTTPRKAAASSASPIKFKSNDKLVPPAAMPLSQEPETVDASPVRRASSPASSMSSKSSDSESDESGVDESERVVVSPVESAAQTRTTRSSSSRRGAASRGAPKEPAQRSASDSRSKHTVPEKVDKRKSSTVSRSVRPLHEVQAVEEERVLGRKPSAATPRSVSPSPSPHVTRATTSRVKGPRQASGELSDRQSKRQLRLLR